MNLLKKCPKMTTYDYLIVGSGLFGATFAAEATAKGKRCLVIDRRSHIGGNVYTAERIVDGVNGFLCEENVESYADRVQAIIADPEGRARVGEEAQRTIYRTWDKVAEEVMEKYKNIIEDYNAKHGKVGSP